MSLDHLLSCDGDTDQNATDGASHRRGPHATRSSIHCASSKPSRHAVPDVVGVPDGYNPTLHARVDEADDAKPVAPGSARVARGVEDPIYSELRGVSLLEGPDAGDQAVGSAADRASEVAAAGEERNVVTPAAAAAASLLVEEVLRGRRELVDISGGDRDLKALVRVVEPVLC